MARKARRLFDGQPAKLRVPAAFLREHRHLLSRAGVFLTVCFGLPVFAHEPLDQAGEPQKASGSPPTSPPPATPVPPPAASQPASFETVVVAPRDYTSASSQIVRDRDFLLRPHRRPADILMSVPGMYVIQHAGGGKANQYFLRGFDADHGTDVAISVDGVPVNAVSHGHGQGYADLNFVIPELVERIEVRKGPYAAQDGDFATAGSFNLVTRQVADRSSITIGGGQFDTYRGLAIVNSIIGDPASGWRSLLAGEIYATNGPFVHGEDLKRLNLFGKLTRDFGAGHLSLTLTSYGAGWNASGQIPRRAVAAGLLDPFDSIDPTEGGNSQRHSAVLAYHAVGEGAETRVSAYVVGYRLGLYSNFTFFSADPVNGDQINQTDERVFAGFRASQRWLRTMSSVVFDTSVGAQVRTDRIETGLYHSVARKRIGRVVDADIGEGSLAVFAQEDTSWTRWMRSVVGIRSDFFGFDVTNRLEPLDPTAPRTSGVLKALRTSPKASLVLGPSAATELFLNFGMGFHSNDARAVVRGDAPGTPLARATGYEIGVRSSLAGRRLDIAASAFGLDLGSETVWVGDEGTTEARGPTRRLGLEAEARLRILPWLFADLDANFVRATFIENPGNANAVALAPTRIISGGLSALHPRGFLGRVGFFHIGDRPATEDRFLRAEGFTRVDAAAGYRMARFELAVTVQNLLNTSWREAQFANVSRLPNETGPASCGPGTRPVEDGGAFRGCEDLHFTPGAPVNVYGSASLFF
jgi:outer membrane receptor protein involved in Fe transport